MGGRRDTIRDPLLARRDAIRCHVRTNGPRTSVHDCRVRRHQQRWHHPCHHSDHSSRFVRHVLRLRHLGNLRTRTKRDSVGTWILLSNALTVRRHLAYWRNAIYFKVRPDDHRNKVLELIRMSFQKYCCWIAINVSHISTPLDLDARLGSHGAGSLHGLRRHHLLDPPLPYHHHGCTQDETELSEEKLFSLCTKCLFSSFRSKSTSIPLDSRAGLCCIFNLFNWNHFAQALTTLYIQYDKIDAFIFNFDQLL